MDIKEVYTKTNVKLSRNAGGDNITVDKPRFVLAYNEQQIRKIEDIINNKNDDEIRYAQLMLTPNKELTINETFSDRVTFNLPKDYLDISSAYCIASKGECKSKKIALWQFKDDNYSEIIFNSNDKPSFEFEESPYIIADDNISVFKDGFEIKKVILTYYRYPKNIDIEGYITADNKPSTNENPEFDDKMVNKIINLVVEEFQTNYQDQLGFQIGKNRILTNN